MRDAQSLLDQLSSMGSTITVELAQAVLGTATSQTVLEVISSIYERAPAVGLDAIHHALDSGADPRTLARQIVDHLRDLMLIQMGNSDQVETTKDLRARMEADAKAFPIETVLRLMRSFNEAAADTRGGWQPSLSLELALAEAFETPAKPAAASASTGTTQQAGKPQAAAPKSEMLYQSTDEPAQAGAGESQKPSISLEEVLRSWKDVRAAIKPAHPAVEALLNSCKPMDIRGSVLLLGFQSETVRGLMDKPENIELTRKAIADILGVDLGIQLVVTNAKGKLPPNISQDGMVAAALNHGGKIVDMDE
jgi:DNA polymerase-3 subunit gamma/tau